MSRTITPQRTGNARELADAFARGMGDHYRSTSALRVTREAAYSYAEPIARFDPSRPGTVMLSDACAKHGGTPFSNTTSKHIGQIRAALEARGVPFDITEHNWLKRAETHA